MEPSCWPPIDCQAWRPVWMSSLVNTTCPDSVTTGSGIGGMTRWISPPTQSRAANETRSRTVNAVQSLRVLLMAALQLGAAMLATAAFAVTDLGQAGFSCAGPPGPGLPGGAGR